MIHAEKFTYNFRENIILLAQYLIQDNLLCNLIILYNNYTVAETLLICLNPYPAETESD